MNLPYPVFDTSYPPPRGNVLLLSCMDMRLLDEVVRFMRHDNLANRYDHLISPGCSLGALGAEQSQFEHWMQAFRDHLMVACRLHHVETVYLLEHRDCGAYAELLKEGEGKFGDTPSEVRREQQVHRRYVRRLERKILEWTSELDWKLTIRSFLMGLRGEVERLDRPVGELPEKPRRSRS